MNSKNPKWNSIVPQPQKLNFPDSSVPLALEQLRLNVSGPFAAEAQKFAARHPQLAQAAQAGTQIRLEQAEKLDPETYEIDITAQGVVIRAGDSAGAFYATMSLSQWLWQHSALPLASLRDKPRFAWRGYMLDVSRHFFPVSYIKELLEQLSSYKINRLHLHLTDDQGWRMPVEGYPRLTEVGASRYWAYDHLYNQTPGKVGFYTEQDIATINECAERLHITVVPEIDLPGHTTAAVASYPELLCSPYPAKDIKVMPLWGVSRNILCLAKQETWDFIYKVLDETCRLFPGKYIHLGGDEVPRHNWNGCPDCQKLIETEGLKDSNDLQNLFTKRSRDYLLKKGKLPLYWDEVEESGLSEGTVCCFWRSAPGVKDSWDVRAAKKGVPVISCPTEGAYFDYAHTSDPHEAGTLGVLTVSAAYNFETLADREPELAQYNMGVQANLWTERVGSPRQAEYLTYPRILAIAEQGWNKGGWELFQQKWPLQQKVLESQGIQNYYRGPWENPQ